MLLIKLTRRLQLLIGPTSIRTVSIIELINQKFINEQSGVKNNNNNPK